MIAWLAVPSSRERARAEKCPCLLETVVVHEGLRDIQAKRRSLVTVAAFLINLERLCAVETRFGPFPQRHMGGCHSPVHKGLLLHVIQIIERRHYLPVNAQGLPGLVQCPVVSCHIPVYIHTEVDVANDVRPYA